MFKILYYVAFTSYTGERIMNTEGILNGYLLSKKNWKIKKKKNVRRGKSLFFYFHKENIDAHKIHT